MKEMTRKRVRVKDGKAFEDFRYYRGLPDALGKYRSDQEYGRSMAEPRGLTHRWVAQPPFSCRTPTVDSVDLKFADIAAHKPERKRVATPHIGADTANRF